MKEFPNNAVVGCRQREYPRLPLGGHLQVKGQGEDVKRPGERLDTELSEMGLSWREAQPIAKDKTRWKRDIVVAPGPTGGDKD